MRQIFDKYRYKFWWVLIGIGSYLLVGCGPIYNTEYTFEPPQSPEGKSCTFQCKNTELQCEQMEKMREENCLLRSKLECKDQKECSTSSCRTDNDVCEEMYRNCYQACGGTVDTHKVCVLNCNN